MRRLQIATVLVAAVASGCAWLPGGLPVPRLGKKPVIDLLSANETTIKPGAQTSLSAAASPAFYGEALTYSWSVTGGTLSTNAGFSVQWTAPATPGRYTATVTVTENGTDQVSGTINLTVQ